MFLKLALSVNTRQATSRMTSIKMRVLGEELALAARCGPTVFQVASSHMTIHAESPERTYPWNGFQSDWIRYGACKISATAWTTACARTARSGLFSQASEAPLDERAGRFANLKNATHSDSCVTEMQHSYGQDFALSLTLCPWHPQAAIPVRNIEHELPVPILPGLHPQRKTLEGAREDLPLLTCSSR